MVPLFKTWFTIASWMISIVLLLDACINVSPSVSIAPSQGPFTDSRYIPPPAQYNGTLFKLSQDYPAQRPDSSQLPGFFNVDFQRDWRNYMMQVRDYCFEDNVEVDWRVENNTVRHWYHMPWQDYGLTGREGIHGLTREASLSKYQLAATQEDGAVAYAIGFYNEYGGYTIGQVWKDHAKPDRNVTSNEGFPIGTVVCKLLFVDMPPDLLKDQIRYLANPIEWQAYTLDPSPTVVAGSPTPTAPPVPPRTVRKVTLIQMDIMIRDDRAPSGWIFGTFQYNGELANTMPWNNLIPVGLMWGNDPDYAENNQNIPVPDGYGKYPIQAVTQTPINSSLKETIINPDTNELPATHLGWEGRLNGPVDNPRSSCMSCHMTASYPAQDLSPMFVDPEQRWPTTTVEWNRWWMQWFQNVGWKNGKLEKFHVEYPSSEKFPEPEYSLDFSLQLSAALQNFDKSVNGKLPENPVQR
jgi:hypothetical protein